MVRRSIRPGHHASDQQEAEGEISLTILRDHNTRTVNLTPEKSKEPMILRPGTIGGQRIIIPSIAIPEINVELPRIVISRNA